MRQFFSNKGCVTAVSKQIEGVKLNYLKCK
jgi:hypothetical protein